MDNPLLSPAALFCEHYAVRRFTLWIGGRIFARDFLM